MRTDVLIAMNSHSTLQRSQEQAIAIVESLLTEAIQDDMKGWDQIGGKSLATLSFKDDIPTLRQESRKAYYRDAYGRGLIRTMVKFVIGAGIIVDFTEKDEKKLADILRWWNRFKKEIRWFSFLTEIVRRTFRDGEVFLRKVSQKGKPLTFRFIDPDLIADDGIKKDPTDAETTVSYTVRSLNGGTEESIPAEEMIHILLDADRNMKRGRPLLEVQFPFLTKHAKWLDARMILSYIRTSVALVREVQGSPMDLSRLRSQYQTSRSAGGETNKTKMLKPGSILTSTPGSKWTMLSPNLDARDASTDGRNLQLGMSAGSGLPDVYVTGDYANSNFASTVVAQNPAIREFEFAQNFFAEPFSDIVEAVLLDGIAQGRIHAVKIIDAGEEEYDTDLNFEIKYPPLIKRDLANEVMAYKTLNEMGSMSVRTITLRVGENPDAEQAQIALERQQGTGPQDPSPTPPLVADPTTNHRKTIAPKTPADRRPRQNVNV